MPIVSCGERRSVPQRPAPGRSLRRRAARPVGWQHLGAALADLPGPARRVALWQARRRGQGRKGYATQPAAPGRPPGFRRRALHAVDDVLAFSLSSRARHALSDTS